MHVDMELIAAVLRAGVGVLLLFAGMAKLRAGLSRFQDAILGFDLVPARWALPLSRALTWAELALGAALLAGIFPRQADALAFLLISSVTGAVMASLLRGRANHCGCIGFSASRVQTVQWHLAYRNLSLLAILSIDACFAVPAGLGRAFALQTPAWFPQLSQFTLLQACIAAGGAIALAHSYQRRAPGTAIPEMRSGEA